MDMITRPNISAIVASQVPDFVREDYPTFIAFLEAYYDFLETQTRVDLKSVRDLDTTLDSFIKYFKAEIGYNIPYTVVNERFLMSHIKDLYLAKGSESSYKLLFRLLFNKDIEMTYPGRQMLRASDGKWEQEVSIFCKVEYGLEFVNKLANLTVDVITSTKIIKVLVNRVSRVLILENDVEKYSEDTYELLIDRKYFGSLSVDDEISYESSFIGKIVPTTSIVEVKKSGVGFKVGQLIPTQSKTGYGSIVKILSVNPDGGIKNVQFVKYGIGYETDVTQTISSDSDKSSDVSTFELDGDRITFNDTLSGFDEVGFVTKNTYNTSGVWDLTYVGEVLSQFSSYNLGIIRDSEKAAVLKISLGGVAKYPGYYKNNDGFLDDDIYIQDSKYYQAFSYVVKIDERIEDFKSAVKTMLHPSGMAMFSEYSIINVFDSSVSLESIIKALAVTLNDQLLLADPVDNNTTDIYDHMIDFYISKSISPDPLELQERKALNFNKIINPYNSSAGFFDMTIVGLAKSIVEEEPISFDEDTENTTIFEVGKALTDPISFDEDTENTTIFEVGKALTDPISFDEDTENTTTFLLNRPIFDSTQEFSDATTFGVGKALTDHPVLFEEDITSFGVGKALIDPISFDEDTENTTTFGVSKALIDPIPIIDIRQFSLAKYLISSPITITDSTPKVIFNKALSDTTAEFIETFGVQINPPEYVPPPTWGGIGAAGGLGGGGTGGIIKYLYPSPTTTNSFIADTQNISFEKSIVEDEGSLFHVDVIQLDKWDIRTTKYIGDTALIFETESGTIRVNAYAESTDWDSEEYSSQITYPLFN